MAIRLIAEIILAFAIILTVTGIPVETVNTTETVTAKSTECWCGKPDSFYDMKKEFHLSNTQFISIYETNYDGKMLEKRTTKHLVSFWIDRLLLLGLYFILLIGISCFLYCRKIEYYYKPFLPLTGIILYIVCFPKNHRENKIKKKKNINETVDNGLRVVLSNLNQHLGR